MNVENKTVIVPVTMSRRAKRLALMHQIERKLLWLSSWMIHNANHVRPNRDGLKVGGHQASCSSVISIMTALYFELLRPQDRVAVKPHAGPVFHAINYLFGRIEGLFRDMGWNVVTIKYGRRLEAAFAREGGEALRAWIDDCTTVGCIAPGNVQRPAC